MLAVDPFISGLADTTSRDYLLHDRACRSLTWQETLQMAKACEASRLLLHPLPLAAASTKVNAPSVDDSTCTSGVGAPSQKQSAPAWQPSAHTGRVMESAHCSRKQQATMTKLVLRNRKTCVLTSGRELLRCPARPPAVLECATHRERGARVR